jgi:hypothetical protein
MEHTGTHHHRWRTTDDEWRYSRKWMKDWDIIHRPRNVYFPNSNNRAEAVVKLSKRMLRDFVSRAGGHLRIP